MRKWIYNSSLVLNALVFIMSRWESDWHRIFSFLVSDLNSQKEKEEEYVIDIDSIQQGINLNVLTMYWESRALSFDRFRFVFSRRNGFRFAWSEKMIERNGQKKRSNKTKRRKKKKKRDEKRAIAEKTEL